jgi:nicotinamide riboside transporter PnuC
MKINTSKLLEWGGVITAILYSFLIAFNINAEFLGFALLLISSFLIALWSFMGKHKGLLLLQLFYAIAAIIGMFRWLN